jgi:Domain of unknown function (DUF4926)
VFSQGAIVFVHNADPPAYEVEFFDESEEAIGVYTIQGDEDLELRIAYKDTK